MDVGGETSAEAQRRVDDICECIAPAGPAPTTAAIATFLHPPTFIYYCLPLSQINDHRRAHLYHFYPLSKFFVCSPLNTIFRIIWRSLRP
jgi:hypothetical protein